MFWKDEGEKPEEGMEETPEEPRGPIRIERDAPRPATILRVAGELEERGGRIIELFKEIESPLGRVVLPIYLRQDDREFFVEVETGRGMTEGRARRSTGPLFCGVRSMPGPDWRY